MTFDKITVVINTFQSEDKINQCLDSIDRNCKVIIVENSANDSFKKKIEANYPNVDCTLVGQNLGYAKGNNFGLSRVKTKFALILNPDAKLDKNAISNFLISANKVKDFSIIGPAKQKEKSFDDSNKEKDDLFEVDNLKGFAMFLNLESFKEIGFFDENFFIYLEEMDLCKRVKNKKKKIYLDKKIIVYHEGGSSHNENINYEMELSRNWHWMWSKFYFNRKHYGYFYSLFYVSGNLFSSLIKIIFYSLMLKKKKRKIYTQRMSGLINSILGKKSWYRPNIIIN